MFVTSNIPFPIPRLHPANPLFSVRLDFKIDFKKT